MGEVVKLVVFVPAEHVEKVRVALAHAGAGRVGNYDCCSFITEGIGHYRPLDGSNPYKGERGHVTSLEEHRIEMMCMEEALPRVLKAMRESHPYEDIAFDVLPLLNHKYGHLVGKRPGL